MDRLSNLVLWQGLFNLAITVCALFGEHQMWGLINLFSWNLPHILIWLATKSLLWSPNLLNKQLLWVGFLWVRKVLRTVTPYDNCTSPLSGELVLNTITRNSWEIGAINSLTAQCSVGPPPQGKEGGMVPPRLVGNDGRRYHDYPSGACYNALIKDNSDVGMPHRSDNMIVATKLLWGGPFFM